MYPYSSRQMTTWERLLAMADPLQTQTTHHLICWLHWFSLQALYFMSDAISRRWLQKSTSSRIRCLCSWKTTDCWLLFTCPALTPTLSQAQNNNKHLPLAVVCFFWSLVAQRARVALILTITYYRNLCFQSVSRSGKTEKREAITLTPLPTGDWRSGRSWPPS